MDVVIRAQDEASGVIEGIGETTEETTTWMEDNFLKVAAAAAAATAAIEALARSQADMTKSTRALARDLDMTEGEIRGVVRSLADATFAVEDVIAVMEIGRQQGIRNVDQLKEYAAFWDTVADATGENVERLAELGMSLRSLGIEAGEEGETINALGLIMRETSFDVSEFLHTIDRSSEEMRDLGIDVDQAAVLMAAFQDETGMSARSLRQEFRQAVREADGDLDGLISQLGLSNEQLEEFESMLEESGEELQKRADDLYDLTTPLQHVQHWFSELSYSIAGALPMAADFSMVLSGISGILPAVYYGKQLLAGHTLAYWAALVKTNVQLKLLNAKLFIKAGATKAAAGGMGALAAVTGKLAGALAVVKTVLGVIVGILSAKIIIIAAVVAAVGAAVYYIVKYWDEIKEAVGRAVEAIKEFFEPAIDWLTEKWEEFRDGVISIWEGITGKIKGFINTIIEGINTVIGALNQINITVPDWVPEIGGKEFGFDIESIPTLHQGGVYRAPNPGGEGLALLRDRERVSPPGEGGGGATYNEYNFYISELVVREEADVEKIARQLNELKERRNRSAG